MSPAVEDRVIDATRRLLRDGTRFTEIGVGEISDEAGIARSTFYVHFADKSDLLLRVAGRAMDDLRDAMDRWWSQRRSGGPVPLAEGMLRLIAAYRRHATVLHAVDEVAGYDAAVASEYRSRVDRYAARLRLELEEDRRAGRVRADLDLDGAPFVAVWSIERTVAEHVRSSPPSADPALARALSHFARRTCE